MSDKTMPDRLRGLKFYPAGAGDGAAYIRRFKYGRFVFLTKYVDGSVPDRADDIVCLGFYDGESREQGSVSFPLMFLLNGTINIDYPY